MTDLSRSVNTGIGWVAGGRLAIRGLGLLSTLIVARILTPADYGLVALATSFIALLDLATSFSFDIALIQRAEARPEHFHTVWTLNILLYACVAAATLLGAPWVARFYQEPRLTHILAWLALAFFLNGFQNTATVAFRRELKFRTDAALMLIQKALGVAVTIPLAVWLRDYRALVAGQVVGAAASVLVSYIARPVVPQLRLDGARELLRFSIWLLFNNVLVFLRSRSFDFLIGKLMGPHALGVFSLAFEVSNLPTTELLAPVNRVVLPVYSQLAHRPEELRREFARLLQWIAVILLPLSVGIGAVAEPAVEVLLGSKWEEAIPLMTPLALAGAFTVLTSNTGALLNALGAPRKVVWVGLLQVGTLLPVVALGMAWGGLVAAAWALALHSLIAGFAIVYAVVLSASPIRLADLLRALWRPVTGVVLMFAAVKGVHVLISPAREISSEALALAIEIAIGACVYVAAVGSLWRVSGRQDGPEAALLRRLELLRRPR